ncbi:MAG: hypothetical protein RR444_07800 [Oscillospiraceae bacterium]
MKLLFYIEEVKDRMMLIFNIDCVDFSDAAPKVGISQSIMICLRVSLKQLTPLIMERRAV